MIRFITATQTFPLRSLVLLSGAAESDCQFDKDYAPTTFHLGYFNENEELCCILTCMKDNHGKIPKDAYRLRGMATHPDHRRKGYAAELLEAAISHLKNQLNNDYLWFNARSVAFPFYEALGFEFISDEFDIPGYGPHREMCKYL